MALSARIIQFLQELDEAGLDVEWARDVVRDSLDADPENWSEKDRREFEAFRSQLRVLTSRLVRERVEPVGEGVDDHSHRTLKEMSELMREDLVDGYFTLKVLGEVAGMVNRWRRLQPIILSVMLNRQVRGYLQQATASYLYGLLDGAMILSRAVLEFALGERMGQPQMKLDGLILAASRFSVGGAAVLPPGLIDHARRIQARGNAAIHRVASSDNEALAQIRETGEILSHLYLGRTADR